MRADISSDGPGPMVLRVDPDNNEPPLGSVLIDFYPEHAEVSIVADNTAEEAIVRARVDAWALAHVGGLLQRMAYGPTQASAPTCCGARRTKSRSNRGSR